MDLDPGSFILGLVVGAVIWVVLGEYGILPRVRTGANPRTFVGLLCVVVAGTIALVIRGDAVVVGLFLGAGLLALGIEAGGRLLR